MASLQEQAEELFEKLEGGREVLLFDYESGMILGGAGLEVPEDPEEAEVSGTIFAGGIGAAVKSYLQAMKTAGIDAPLEENIQMLGHLFTLMCPLEKVPGVMLLGSISAEDGNVGMLRLQIRQAAKTMSL